MAANAEENTTTASEGSPSSEVTPPPACASSGFSKSASKDAVSCCVGVDLGGHSSVVASAGCDGADKKSGMISVDVNNMSNRATPTIFSFDNRIRYIGEEAEVKMTSNPANTITHLLEALGRDFEEMEEIKRRFSYTCRFSFLKNEDNNQTVIPVKFNNERYKVTSELILSIYIKYLIKLATNRHGGETENANVVISVPSSFNQKQICSAKAACKLAGLRNVEFRKSHESAINCWANSSIPAVFDDKINTFYANKCNKEENEEGKNKCIYVAFFDCGYTHTSFCITKFEKVNNITNEEDKFEENKTNFRMEVLSTKINANLGTHEMVMALADYVVSKTNEKEKKTIDFKNKRGVKVYNACMKSLKELSGLPTTSIYLEGVLEDGGDVEVSVDRALLENLCAPIQSGIEKLLEEGLKESGLEVSDICGCEVIGGGTRVPFVVNILSKFLNINTDSNTTENHVNGTNVNCCTIRRTLDSASSVAIGACMYSIGKAWKNYEGEEKQTEDETEADKNVNDDTTNYIQDQIELLKKMDEIEEKEICRLKSRNALEEYIIYIKNEMEGKNKDLLQNEKLLPLIEKQDKWLCEKDVDGSITFTEYSTALEELKGEVEKMCPEFFEKIKKDAEEKEREIASFAQNEKHTTDDTHLKLPPAQAIKKAKKNKDEGNDLFKDGNLEMAILRYIKSLQYLNELYDVPPQHNEEINSIKLATNLNLAQCYIKIGSEVTMKKAISCCDVALEIREDNLKALFRRAVAKEFLKDFDAANIDVKKGLQISPKDADFLKVNDRIEKHLKAQRQKEKKMYGKMFA